MELAIVKNQLTIEALRCYILARILYRQKSLTNLSEMVKTEEGRLDTQL